MQEWHLGHEVTFWRASPLMERIFEVLAPAIGADFGFSMLELPLF
jgi:hypothetical protein